MAPRSHTFRRADGEAVSGLSGEEGVPVDLERAGIGLAGSTAEGVDGRADLDVDEADFGEHLMPALTGQPTGNSTGPQVDVTHGFWWDGSTVGDVGELQDAARLEDAVDLVERGALVGAEVDHAVGDHDVGPCVLDR